MPDPFLDALQQERAPSTQPTTSGEPFDAFSSALQNVRAQDKADSRSWFAKTVDALSEPPPPVKRFVDRVREGATILAQPDLNDSVAMARFKGAVAGAIGGNANGGGGLVDTAAHMVASPIGLALSLAPPLAGAAEAAGAVRSAQALRAAETGLGGAVAARGVEQTADAKTLPEVGEGLLQTAFGAVGARAGVRGYLRMAPAAEAAPAVIRGALRPAPGFIAPEAGPAAPFGTEIPMEKAPDGSYVRSVPGEYARRDIRGFLRAGPGFVAPEAGPAATLEQAQRASQPDAFFKALDAERQPAAPNGPDPSMVRGVPAAPTAYTVEDRSVVPTHYSSDVNATAAPHVELSPMDEYALKWIRQDMDAIPFSSRNYNQIPRGRGGSLEVSGGGAGAPIYRAIVGEEGREVVSASRGDVIRAIDNLLAGRLTRTGELTLGVARNLVEGKPAIQRLMVTGPPDIGVGPALAGMRAAPVDPNGELTPRDYASALAHEGETPIAEVPFALSSEASQPKAAQGSLLGAGSTIREPGEEGAINPTLAARVGLGGAGAAYGAATGTDMEDRLKRAALFGAAGALAPSLLGEMGGVAASASNAARAGERQVGPVGAAGEPARMFTPKPGAMPSGPIPASRPMPEEQKLDTSWLGRYSPELRTPIAKTFQEYDGFEPQRRFVQPDKRVEALAQQIAVDMAPHRAGSIVNVEESRAMANATATLFDRLKAIRAQLASGTGDPDALTAQLSKLYQDGVVMLGNVRANASEQGRALRGQALINAALSTYDERIIAEAGKRLRGSQLKLFTDQLAQLPDDPRAFYQLLQQHLQQQRGPTDQFFSYLYNNVLSGATTFFKNVLGTGTNTLFQAGSNVVAGALEARKPLADRSVLLNESAASASAAVEGLFRGGKAALYVLRHGFDPLAVERGEIPPAFTEMPGGAATNWPTRLTRAVHGVFFSEAARAFEAHSIAYTQAAKEAAAQNLTGDALRNYLASRTAQIAISPDVQAQAAAYGQRNTFTEDMGPTGRAFGQLLNSNKALRFLQLFYKIPFNIAKQQLRDNTPLAFLPQLGDSGVYAGGRVGAQAQARAVLGTALLAPFAAMAASGAVTGEGPTDPKHRPLWLATHQPNSIRIGDHWIDYRALPIATPLSMIANLHEAYQEGQASDADTSAMFSQIASRVGNVITSQPFLAGLTSFVHAMESPAEQGSRLLKSSAQMLVPYSGMLRNVTHAIDPVYREVHSVGDAVKEVIPGQSSTLPPRLDVFGGELKRPGGAFIRGFMVPAAPVPANPDPLTNYLEDIHQPMAADHRQSTLTVAPGVRVPVPSELDLSRRQEAGQQTRAILERVVASPRFQGLPVPQQQEIVSELTGQMRGSARARMDAQVRALVIQRLQAAGAR